MKCDPEVVGLSQTKLIVYFERQGSEVLDTLCNPQATALFTFDRVLIQL